MRSQLPELLPDLVQSMTWNTFVFSEFSNWRSRFKYHHAVLGTGFTESPFGLLTSHCKTASPCWASGTRTAGPGGILPSRSRRLYPGPDPGTLTVPCLSPYQSADEPVSSGKKKSNSNTVRLAGLDLLIWITCIHSPSMLTVTAVI